MNMKKKENGQVRTATVEPDATATLPETPVTQEPVKTASTLKINTVDFEGEKLFALKVSKRGDHICVYAQTYGSNPRKINIRSFYENEADELAPTKKGVGMTIEQLEALLPVLQQVLESEKALAKSGK